MKTNQQQLNDRKALRHFLSRYYRAKDRQAHLRRRLSELRRELDGLGGNPPSFDNIHGKGQTGQGAATMALRILDIEERIEKQKDAESQIILEIMDVIELLPAGSVEREIIEFRHIDCKSWEAIGQLVHFTRSSCFDNYNKGLDALLGFRKVRELIGTDRR